MFNSLLKIFKFKNHSGARPKKGIDPVYDFFVYSKPGVRKRAYKRALEAAQKEQMELMRKAEAMRSSS